ncbi:hypothetical protein E2C01_008292 [Portunus trituberculatus]|uniref:Uncharacterized protein n=1 Tax=Portunus trituberculatus TaxID=210409 RepID=A0A5B7D1G6_PORTR|nr:hypothetical protein [Portunus trituberculatus]
MITPDRRDTETMRDDRHPCPCPLAQVTGLVCREASVGRPSLPDIRLAAQRDRSNVGLTNG